MPRIKIVAISLALFSGLNFTLCVIYGLVVPDSLHAEQLLEMILPGLNGFLRRRTCSDLPRQ